MLVTTEDPKQKALIANMVMVMRDTTQTIISQNIQEHPDQIMQIITSKNLMRLVTDKTMKNSVVELRGMVEEIMAIARKIPITKIISMGAKARKILIKKITTIGTVSHRMEDIRGMTKQIIACLEIIISTKNLIPLLLLFQ